LSKRTQNYARNKKEKLKGFVSEYPGVKRSLSYRVATKADQKMTFSFNNRFVYPNEEQLKEMQYFELTTGKKI